jgi:hypothetical protein
VEKENATSTAYRMLKPGKHPEANPDSSTRGQNQSHPDVINLMKNLLLKLRSSALKLYPGICWAAN